MYGPGGVKLTENSYENEEQPCYCRLRTRRGSHGAAPRIYGKLQVIAGHLFAGVHSLLRPSFVLFFLFRFNSFFLLFPNAISSSLCKIIRDSFQTLNLQVKHYRVYRQDLKGFFRGRTWKNVEERSVDHLFVYSASWMLVSHSLVTGRIPFSLSKLPGNQESGPTWWNENPVGVLLLQRRKSISRISCDREQQLRADGISPTQVRDSRITNTSNRYFCRMTI